MADEQQQQQQQSPQTLAAASSPASVNVSELGKALDQTSISIAFPGDGDDDEPDAGDDEDDYDDDDDEDDDDDDENDDDDEDGGAADDDDDDDDELAEESDDYGMASAATSPVKRQDAAAAPLKSKSPKKRGRTDSLKKMLPAPASQRHKQRDDGSVAMPVAGSGAASEFSSGGGGGGADDDAFGLQKAQPAKLLVKDRTGAGMGVPRPHLISNAVKQAPPAKEKSNPRRWSKHEDESLRLAVERSGERNWKAIADQVPGRNHTQCLQRWTKVLKPGLIKGHWTPEEDTKLRELVTEEKKNWGQVASLIPGRTSKQCRERWCNHLDPNINKGSYTEDEDKIIIEMQSKLGNRWSIIAQQLKGRTEDAVKIRWKSLMRGRRAAMKDEKNNHGAAAGAPVATDTAPSPSEKSKPKAAAKATPSRQKTRAASPVIKAEKTNGLAALSTEKLQGSGAMMAASNSITNLEPADLSLDNDDAVGKMDGLDLAAAMGLPGVTDDIVAASIHNFQMSQRYQNSAVAAAAAQGGMYATAAATSQTISPVNHAMYASQNGYAVNTVAPQNAYAMQHGYGAMPSSASMAQSYGVPTSYGASAQQMGMPVQGNFYSGMHNSMHNPSQGYSQGGYGAPRQMYQQPSSAAMGFPTSMYQPNGVPMTTQNFGAMHAGAYSGGSFSGNPMPSAGSNHSAGMNIGLPPSSAAAAAKMLATPREEWGSSQTPRSQMIMTEGHASAYELFHQQRVRLMMQEREKHGLTLSSAPSPGQAMLTKELEANKERQKRQAIMQKGWKSAVEAMMANSDFSSLDDQQRFDGFLEKVSLSALDPTDDELINDIIADESLDVETPVG